MTKPLVLLAVLILALAAATWWRASSRVAEAVRAYPPEGQFVEVGGHPVHYVQKGTGPDLVLIHGASGNTRDFTFALVDQLTDRYRVTVFDRPGLGHTPRLAARGVTLADQADLLVRASRALRLDRPIVLGQSFGGAVAMTWAVDHPDDISAVVDVSGATYPWPGDLDRLYATMAKPVIGPALAWTIGAWVSRGYIDRAIAGVFAPQNEPSGYASYIGAPLVIRPHSLIANAQQRTELREELRALAPRYGTLTLPIEIVHGDADDTVSLRIHSEALANDVPSARLTVLPGIGHMPHHVAQAEVIAAIDRARTRIAPR
ncbi:alpha/beta fold hydrolase [Pseudooceanicola onchidii]|uniref:alpha/beta fold hydrolase n=1 Tax=Pseudooceanicola onchidii TaxID=2562279 RepID=UPI001F0D948D|nr:alpha/beta hydrolase [Pseudooceanicola onchidii]